jgi:hypothetical protein
VNGVPASGATFNVDQSTITFSSNGTNYNLPVPNGKIVFSPGASVATTTFDSGTNTWTTTVPVNQSGDVFFSGLPLPLPAGLPGGTNPVSWTAHFSSTTPGLSFNWQWGAAVYTSFGTGNAIGVKPVESNGSAYQNSDHAGTPENFKSFVVGGARGGGGSNWTGSWSGTDAGSACVVAPTPVVAGAFGNLHIGDQTSTPPAVGSQFEFGTVFTLGQAGTTVDLQFYARGGAADQSFIPVVYAADAAGNPTTLVLTGTQVTVKTTDGPQWFKVQLPAKTLAPGNYLLGLMSGETSAGAVLYYDIGTGKFFFAGPPAPGGFPPGYPIPFNTWPASGGTSNQKLSIFVELS